MADTVDLSIAESVYLTLLGAQHKPITAAADLVRALKAKRRTAAINPTRSRWHRRMPGSPFARYPKALIATTRLPPRFGLARLAARKSGEIFWTELARHSGALRPARLSSLRPGALTRWACGATGAGSRQTLAAEYSDGPSNTQLRPPV
jgi:hypothetical protein